MTKQTRKRYTPEALLAATITDLEAALPDATDTTAKLMDLYGACRAVVLRLLEFGPLTTSSALWLTDFTDGTEDYGVTCAELLQFVRSVVERTDVGVLNAGIGTDTRVTFKALAIGGGRHVGICCDGRPRDVAVLQLMMLLREVGLQYVRRCAAPDCRRLFVKTYRREYCSIRCQKRVYMRTRRANAETVRQRRARQRRRQKGA